MPHELHREVREEGSGAELNAFIEYVKEWIPTDLHNVQKLHSLKQDCSEQKEIGNRDRVCLILLQGLKRLKISVSFLKVLAFFSSVRKQGIKFNNFIAVR